MADFVCETCGETFPVPVWECGCGHHTHAHDTPVECGNCHRFPEGPAFAAMMVARGLWVSTGENTWEPTEAGAKLHQEIDDAHTMARADEIRQERIQAELLQMEANGLIERAIDSDVFDEVTWRLTEEGHRRGVEIAMFEPPDPTPPN